MGWVPVPGPCLCGVGLRIPESPGVSRPSCFPGHFPCAGSPGGRACVASCHMHHTVHYTSTYTDHRPGNFQAFLLLSLAQAGPRPGETLEARLQLQLGSLHMHDPGSKPGPDPDPLAVAGLGQNAGACTGEGVGICSAATNSQLECSCDSCSSEELWGHPRQVQDAGSRKGSQVGVLAPTLGSGEKTQRVSPGPTLQEMGTVSE